MWIRKIGGSEKSKGRERSERRRKIPAKEAKMFRSCPGAN